ncbi:unnamed protein product [Prorocentrum cordatum]|uniref:Peptidyl-prolyl cis-trans isomerase n=1 Tax=Prorocentrum cordatum TaxID=2364126 RepID=A0ABN9QNX4_9DINO|nr:unnamed protein product [Polarella glacialis]
MSQHRSLNTRLALPCFLAVPVRRRLLGASTPWRASRNRRPCAGSRATTLPDGDGGGDPRRQPAGPRPGRGGGRALPADGRAAGDFPRRHRGGPEGGPGPTDLHQLRQVVQDQVLQQLPHSHRAEGGDYIAQTGDPTNTGKGGSSIHAKLPGLAKRFFDDEITPALKHNGRGTVAMANEKPNENASQFYITLREEVEHLDGKHTIFGSIAEGQDVLDKINNAMVDENNAPFQNIRIWHTEILDDPFDDPDGLAPLIPPKSPEVIKDEELKKMETAADEAELEDPRRWPRRSPRAKPRQELLHDIPDADIAVPESGVLQDARLRHRRQTDRGQFLAVGGQAVEQAPHRSESFQGRRHGGAEGRQRERPRQGRQRRQGARRRGLTRARRRCCSPRRRRRGTRTAAKREAPAPARGRPRSPSGGADRRERRPRRDRSRDRRERGGDRDRRR